MSNGSNDCCCSPVLYTFKYQTALCGPHPCPAICPCPPRLQAAPGGEPSSPPAKQNIGICTYSKVSGKHDLASSRACSSGQKALLLHEIIRAMLGMCTLKKIRLWGFSTSQQPIQVTCRCSGHMRSQQGAVHSPAYVIAAAHSSNISTCCSEGVATPGTAPCLRLGCRVWWEHLIGVVKEGGVLDLLRAFLRAPIRAHVEVPRVVAQPVCRTCFSISMWRIASLHSATIKHVILWTHLDVDGHIQVLPASGARASQQKQHAVPVRLGFCCTGNLHCRDVW